MYWVGPVGGCASAGPVGSTVAAALQFFAASQCLLHEAYPRQAAVTNGSSFDLIVVGGGTAGSALAARLAKLRHLDVLLIEAGGDPPEESIVPGFREALKATQYDWNFTTVNDGYASQALAGRRQLQPRGRMLGGSGALNDMVYARGHPADYCEWADISGDAWNWTNVLPYFIKTERMTDDRILHNKQLMKYHGTHGDIEVSGTNIPDSPNTKLLEAFQELGFNVVDDMTYPHRIGAGKFSHTITRGRRDGSLTGMLNKVPSNNLRVLKNALVTQILIENNTAVGVKALVDNEQLYFYAHKEVIVSAGTFNTPKLLMLSGIGPKEHLEELGIDVAQDLPIGDNLHDHVMVIFYLAAEPGLCTRSERDEHYDVIRYLYDSSGPLSYSDSVGVYLPQTGGPPDVPYFAIYPSCVPRGRMSYEGCMLAYTNHTCSTLVKESENNEIISLAVVLLKPRSRGKVRLYSKNPLEDPLIYSGTFNVMEDIKEFPDAIELALSLVNTTYFKQKGARIVDIVPERCAVLEGRQGLRCAAQELAMSAWHAAGTAALGSVLDDQLRVRGVRALRVADASVMPTIVRGNTNAPVIMIAEKAADIIKNTYGGN